jgi:hypothetical protein
MNSSYKGFRVLSKRQYIKRANGIYRFLSGGELEKPTKKSGGKYSSINK